MFGTKSKNKRHLNSLHWVIIITQYMLSRKSKNNVINSHYIESLLLNIYSVRSLKINVIITHRKRPWKS